MDAVVKQDAVALVAMPHAEAGCDNKPHDDTRENKNDGKYYDNVRDSSACDNDGRAVDEWVD